MSAPRDIAGGSAPATRRRAVLLPGTDAALEYERDTQGRLLGLRCAGRTYLATADGRRTWDGGFAQVEELLLGDRLLRRVHAGGTRWDELYRWDERRRPVHVDGVDVERDALGRVIACRDTLGARDRADLDHAAAAPTWHYRYEHDALALLATPDAVRALPAEQRDAPLDVAPVPAGWERDGLGRLWLVRGADGAIRHTYLWDGLCCLARLDGPPGAPIAALFSLDTGGTPVRVVTREGFRRVPRDAFGENLLLERGVPGLFGGAVHGGAVHYRSRALLPRLGRFAQPDPLHGGPDDPRRADGFDGTLAAETRGGRFAVCQHDPVGRADPFGEFSWAVLLSDLTWSLQNNLLGIFGLDLTINFWLSLTVMPFPSKPGDKIANARDYFLFDGFVGTRQDTWAIRRGGLIAGSRTFTFQHLLFDAGHELPGDPNTGCSLEQMSLTRAIDPQGDFRPRMYGSVLLASPKGFATMALLGDRVLGNALNAMSPPVLPPGWSPLSSQTMNALYTWSRAGGVGEPAFPGSRVPVFPAGGLHLDLLVGALPPDTACTLEELEPGGAVAIGTLSGRVRLAVPGTGLGLKAGGLVLLTDGNGRSAILPIDAVEEADGGTSLWLDDDPAGIDRTGLRLRALVSPAASVEDLARSADKELNLVGAAVVPAGAPTPDYGKDDALRFALPATPGAFLGADTIAGFAVRLQLDAAPTADANLSAERATAVGSHSALTTGAADTLEFDAADLPGSGQPIVVSSGSLSLAVVVKDAVSGSTFRLDRPLAGFPVAPAGTKLAWAALTGAGNDLAETAGTATASGDVLAYVPSAERAAPPVGEHVLLTSASAGLCARRVIAVQADALVPVATLPAGATLRVERFTFPAPGSAGAVDVSDVSLVAAVNVALTSQQKLEGQLLAVLQLGPGPLSAAGTQLGRYTLVNADGEVSLDLGAGAPALSASLLPSAVVVLNNGAALAPALVKRIILRVTLDRVLPAIHGATGLEMVLLASGGPTWDAAYVDGSRIQVLPTIGGTAAQMPRFAVGQVVLMRDGATTVTGRISDADGLLLTLEGREADLPAAGTAGSPTLRLLDFGFTGAPTFVTDPGTGCARSGIRGRGFDGGPGAPAPPSVLELDVWDPTVMAAGTRLGIIVPATGNLPARTFVASVAAVVDARLAFGGPPGVVGAAGVPVTVHAATISAGFLSRQFRQEGDDRIVVVPDVPAGLALAEQLVALVPFAAPKDGARADGTTTSGTYKVPDEVTFESERQDALINHELQHCFQAAMWGPLFFCWFPLLAAQIPLELKGDVDVPKFSASIAAFVERRKEGTFLKIADAQGVPFDTKDKVQLTTSVDHAVPYLIGKRRSANVFLLTGPAIDPCHVHVWQGDAGALAVAGDITREDGVIVLTVPDPGGFTFGESEKVNVDGVGFSDLFELGPKAADGAFQLKSGEVAPQGTVRVRRAAPGGWVTAFEVLRGFSMGSLGSSLIESTWGQLLRFLGKGVYGAGRAIFGSDDRADATVSDDRTALVFAADLPKNLAGVDRVIVTQGDSMLTARVATPPADAPAAPGARIVLTSPLALTGAVKVGPYSTTNQTSDFDWYDYFPAQANVPLRPFAITIEAAGKEKLALEPFHRVLLRAGKTEVVTQVTAVDAEGLVELADLPPTIGPERDLQVAKIDYQDPTAISPFDPRGMDWLRIVLDPWAQLDYRTHSSNEVVRWLTRSARWAFGSHSWSLGIPGFYILDNVFKQIGSNGHLSQMEQDASANSGDLYAPLSRLVPDDTDLFVGDLRRFHYWPWNTGREFSTVVRSGRGDAPGVHIGNSVWPHLMPSFTAENDSLSPQTVNMGSNAPAGSGALLPDALVQKAFAFPARDDPTLAAPAAFSPSQQGFLPSGPKVERPAGCYVGFTQAGTHRVSVNDTVGVSTDASGKVLDSTSREAHEGAPLFMASQPILFDMTVKDVSVSVAGRAVAQGDTVTLVLTQRAAVSVKAGDGDDDVVRDHALALLSPSGGAVLRADGDLTLVARGATGSEPCEVQRLHAENSPDLVPNGLHLGGSLRIPVRQLTVSVVDTLAVHAPLPGGAAFLADGTVNAVANLKQGVSGFLIVPTAVRGELALVTVNGAPPAAGAPVLIQSAPAVVDPVLLAALGGDGGVLEFSFDPAVPLAASAALELSLPVGRTGNEAALKVTLTLDP